MNTIKVYSRRLKEATASLNLFAPSALGPLVLGQTILCNPNRFNHPKPFLPLISPVLGLTRDIMSPKFSKPSHSTPSCIHPFFAYLNLNLIVEVYLVKLNHYLSFNNIPATLLMDTEEVAL